MMLSSEINSFHKELGNSNEALDWIEFIATDEEMIKLTRLVITLLYVENPQDEDVLSILIENIEINAPKTRGKKITKDIGKPISFYLYN